MKKRRPITKKKAFIQDWGTYRNQTLVVVGMNHAEILQAMKRLKCDREAIAEFEKEKKELEQGWLIESHSGMMWFNEGRSILWLPNWADDWKHYETLIHELYHAVHNILCKDKKMQAEEEACAYQQEYLFRELRRKLNE